MERVFEYIKPSDNDILFDMNGSDLQNLLILIDNCYVKLRDNLSLNNIVTFGLEIEMENVTSQNLDALFIEKFGNLDWIIKRDLSLTNGAEINSPILRDTNNNWKSIDEVCEFASNFAEIGKCCGGHIHIGAHVLGNDRDSWINFLRLWSAYENVIFRFSNGNFLTARPSIDKHAHPMAYNFWRKSNIIKNDKLDLKEMLSLIADYRCQAVNFKNVSNYFIDVEREHNTIEFRCPNGSLDSIIWQNNVNLFAKMLLYSKNTNFDDDKISKRYELNEDMGITSKFYDEIFLDQVLEFCDLIFNNNLDKIYFLRQYLKSLQVYNPSKGLVKAKQITNRKCN